MKDKMKLLTQAILKFLLGAITFSLILFASYGSINFLEGWILISLLFIPMFICGIILFFKNPNLLKERLDAKETETKQQLVIKLSGLMYIVGLIIAGLNYRYNWYLLPKWCTLVFSIVFIIFYILYGVVLKENAYLSRTIKVQENQKVIDTGLYSIVRHPMYHVTLFLFLSMPLILRSFYSFLVFLIYPIIIIMRINNEEKILEKDLPGYTEYKKKVKYRLIPFIW